MNDDFSAFVSQEQFITPGARRKLYVPTDTRGASRHLMLRNANRDGPSVARVYGVEIRFASANEERAEQLRTFGPIGVPIPRGGTVQAFGPRISPPEFQPILVETHEQEYSDAVSFGLTTPQEMEDAGAQHVVLNLQVEAGALSIGCTAVDHVCYVDREVYAPSGLRRKVYVPLGSPGAAAHLMVRNANPRGRSVARIHGIEIRRLSAAEELQENLKSSDQSDLFISDGNVVARRRFREIQNISEPRDPGLRDDPRDASRLGREVRMKGGRIERPPIYLIYQLGKAASQTIEWSIRRTDEAAQIERHIYLSDEMLHEMDEIGSADARRQMLVAQSARSNSRHGSTDFRTHRLS